MPVFYEQINDFAKLAIWHIVEEKNFFLEKVPLRREITHPHKQLQHLAGRYLLQHLYPDFPYHLIEIADTRKPFLPNEEYHFSISHCGDYAVVIVSKDHRVGIDIKMVNGQSSMVNNEMRILTLLWSCKEAVFKWMGSGGIDFKDDIHLKAFHVNHEEGIIQCEFLKEENIALQIQYKHFDGMSLAWIATN
jgi:phosphopantetheinyl transferase